MMLFQDEHIDMIKDGRKHVTRRDWMRKMAKEGGSYPIQTHAFQSKEDCHGFIECTALYKQKLGDMTEEDAWEEGGYELQGFREVWGDINGEWDPDKEVYVVEFDYIGEEDPRG